MERQRNFRITTREMTLIGLFAAITAVFSQIAIPMTPVPFSLGLLGVLLAATILETKLAVCSQLVFVLLGAAGAPVFSGFQGGLQRLVGPTGGFLAAYILMPLVIGRILSNTVVYNVRTALIANAAGLLVCYTLGAAWLAFSMRLTLKQTLASAVLPFIPLDLVKAGIAAFAGKRLCAVFKTVRQH